MTEALIHLIGPLAALQLRRTYAFESRAGTLPASRYEGICRMNGKIGPVFFRADFRESQDGVLNMVCSKGRSSRYKEQGLTRQQANKTY